MDEAFLKESSDGKLVSNLRLEQALERAKFWVSKSVRAQAHALCNADNALYNPQRQKSSNKHGKRKRTLSEDVMSDGTVSDASESASSANETEEEEGKSPKRRKTTRLARKEGVMGAEETSVGTANGHESTRKQARLVSVPLTDMGLYEPLMEEALRLMKMYREAKRHFSGQKATWDQVRQVMEGSKLAEHKPRRGLSSKLTQVKMDTPTSLMIAFSISERHFVLHIKREVEGMWLVGLLSANDIRPTSRQGH